MGINGFLKKRKESRFFEAPKISATHIKQKRDAEKPNKKEKRAVKYANSGTATFFTPNVGSCGWKNKPSDLIVAVNGKDMKNASGKSNKNPLCGKMVEVTNSSGKKIRAKIVDTCPGCSKGDLDLSPAAFSKLAPLSKGILKIKWRYV
ncbi:RlpA-like double-psi beta-barrel-protein domain-containing protein-containing protein [Pilaira anomala]|nr:RlpA-like double-psi beta-barrel-protein domain-containing protein-containing protein [Pilaira anomala]